MNQRIGGFQNPTRVESRHSRARKGNIIGWDRSLTRDTGDVEIEAFGGEIKPLPKAYVPENSLAPFVGPSWVKSPLRNTAPMLNRMEKLFSDVKGRITGLIG
jgi:hypothetical protein